MSSRLERGRVELGGLGETGAGVVGVADLELVAAEGGDVCEEVGESCGRGVRAPCVRRWRSLGRGVSVG
jgi:hypothetical protein